MNSFSLTADPIVTHPSHAHDAAGGYVVFEGRVRNQNEGREVLSLEYEAFDEMAVKTGSEVLAEAQARFQLLDVRCIHRTGHLQIGDIAIRVEVASAHRKAAFEACDWIVDEIKARVPIWKKEHYAEGDSGWINCESRDGGMAAVSASRPNIASYYERQIRLKEVGVEGQAKLSNAKVLVVGAGGLGSPALLYLAASGIGTLGLVEFDDLDVTNLHRQILYSSTEVGTSKGQAAADRLRKLNPSIQVVPHEDRLTHRNANAIIEGYDIVLDCTDNFRTKFLLNDVCVQARKTLIQASIYQYEGQMLIVQPGSPCLRCLWAETPDEGCVGSCAEVGVLGVVPGFFGTLQASETIKLVLGMSSPLRESKMLLFDLVSLHEQMIGIERNPSCPACGSGASGAEPDWNLEASEIDFASYFLVDVREAEEVSVEPLANSINLPTSHFDSTLLPSTDRYLLVCSHGFRSQRLAKEMRRQGDHRFFSLVGGLASLKASK